MSERAVFWKGFGAGVAGAAIVSAIVRVLMQQGRVRFQSPRTDPSERFYRFGMSEERPPVRRSQQAIPLRRESGESAGDPRLTHPGSESGVVEGRAFERPAGAPGGRTPAERLEVPGRPGQPI